ncbi:MAG TPA: YraN family protein [Longilinea sp.]|nr:YraN family protein [Longilinea sp.]
MTNRQQIGRWGEQCAAEFLVGKGYQLVARNARTPFGEIDLIFRSDGQIVFVEVKTRTSLAYGLPEEAVDRRKGEHILKAADAYLQEHPELDDDWRVDVIAIIGKPENNKPQIEWFQDAIS